MSMYRIRLLLLLLLDLDLYICTYCVLSLIIFSLLIRLRCGTVSKALQLSKYIAPVGRFLLSRSEIQISSVFKSWVTRDLPEQKPNCSIDDKLFSIRLKGYFFYKRFKYFTYDTSQAYGSIVSWAGFLTFFFYFGQIPVLWDFAKLKCISKEKI